MRASYNGYYICLPSRKWRFDSARPLRQTFSNLMKHHQVAERVTDAYLSSKDDLAHWMLKEHVQVVAANAEELSKKYGANEDLAVAGAWLHDLGDAFVRRHASDHEAISVREACKILKDSGYSSEEIREVTEVIIALHSCKEGNLPQTPEGKVLATADAFAHLSTDFYLQFAWKHMPEGKSYEEFIAWVGAKIERDFHNKIFFDDVRDEMRERYKALKIVFTRNNI